MVIGEIAEVVTSRTCSRDNGWLRCLSKQRAALIGRGASPDGSAVMEGTATRILGWWAIGLVRYQ